MARNDPDLGLGACTEVVITGWVEAVAARTFRRAATLPLSPLYVVIPRSIVPETAPVTATVLPAIATLSAQVELGVHELAGLPADELRILARAAAAHGGDGALLAVHPDLASTSAHTSLLQRDGNPGFTVTDLPSADRFAPCVIELSDGLL